MWGIGYSPSPPGVQYLHAADKAERGKASRLAEITGAVPSSQARLHGEAPDEYYDFLAGGISEASLIAKYPVELEEDRDAFAKLFERYNNVDVIAASDSEKIDFQKFNKTMTVLLPRDSAWRLFLLFMLGKDAISGSVPGLHFLPNADATRGASRCGFFNSALQAPVLYS